MHSPSLVKMTFLHKRHGLVRVKTGFSWPAFFFGSLWAAAKRMWFPEFLLLIVVDAGLWFATGLAEASGKLGLALLGLVATIIYAFVRGRHGNRWLSSSLLRRGYELQGPRAV